MATPSESAFFKKTQIRSFLCEKNKKEIIVLTMGFLVGNEGLKKKDEPHKRIRKSFKI